MHLHIILSDSIHLTRIYDAINMIRARMNEICRAFIYMYIINFLSAYKIFIFQIKMRVC